MMVLDTNVLAEPTKPVPNDTVLEWVLAHADPVVTTAITVGELLSGIARLSPGRRRECLLAAVESLLTVPQRILAYDQDAARCLPFVQSQSRMAGRPMSIEDAMIAAICLVNNAQLATRNVRDFAHIPGLKVLNPWRATPRPRPS